MYIARQLSFSGVNFDVKEVKLCATFIEMYDAAVTLVRNLSLMIERCQFATFLVCPLQ